jgi:hypothetical protein
MSAGGNPRARSEKIFSISGEKIFPRRDVFLLAESRKKQLALAPALSHRSHATMAAISREATRRVPSRGFGSGAKRRRSRAASRGILGEQPRPNGRKNKKNFFSKTPLTEEVFMALSATFPSPASQPTLQRFARPLL